MKNQKLENTLDIAGKENTISSEIMQYEHLENSPFTLVNNEGKWYGLMGNHRLTEAYEDRETLVKELTEITWNRLTQVMWAISEKVKTIELLKDEQ
jgi:hypothetical protein